MLGEQEEYMYTDEQVEWMNSERQIRLDIAQSLQDGLDVLAAGDITSEMFIRYVGQIVKDLGS
jgi:hypothetical protein